MFREMRRKDKALNDSGILEVLNNAPYGTLITNGVHGYPCPVPINYTYCDGLIYMHGATAGEKWDNINENNKVSFCAVDYFKNLASEFDTDYSSVVIYGEAFELFDGDKTDALLKIIMKYSIDFVDKGKDYIEKAGKNTRVFAIKPIHMTGKFQK